ncbi:MAG: VENN motif pre-toxin domain-containing protein [Acinetobacter sp.]
MPEDIKTQIRDLTAGIGVVIGGAAGDSTYNAQLAGVIGQNAVENNELTLPYGDTAWAQGVDSLLSDAKKKGLSDKETQKLLEAYGQPDAKQGREYIEGLARGSVETGASIILPELIVPRVVAALDPIVVVATKSKWYTSTIDTVKGWFGKDSNIEEATRYVSNIENDVLNSQRVGYGDGTPGSGNKIDQIKAELVTDVNGNKISVNVRPDGNPMGKEFANQELPHVPRAHGFNDIIDNFAGSAHKTILSSGASLYQVEGTLNGVAGRFEWIIDPKLGGVSHRMFVKNGKITGVPTKK